MNRIEAEYAARPIDDAEWVKELARRAEVERIDALPDSEWFELEFPEVHLTK